MCNALSPEKSVIWSVLHGVSSDHLKIEYFSHPVYRLWFEAAARLQGCGRAVNFVNIERELETLGFCQSDADKRALKRLLRVDPPSRVQDNANVFMRSLADTYHGRRVHIERLIN